MIAAEMFEEEREHLDVLAERWSVSLGEMVSRSDVVREFVRRGLDEHPVTPDELDLHRKGHRREVPAVRTPRAAKRLDTSEKGGGEGGILRHDAPSRRLAV